VASGFIDSGDNCGCSARVACRRFAADADRRTRRNTTVECPARSYFCGFVNPREIGRRSRPTCDARSFLRAFALFAVFAFLL